jgi:hypothetical protein
LTFTRIVHLARHAASCGKVILRFDSANAFNVASRSRIRQLLADGDPEVLRYFATVYVPTSDLCIFGPEGARHYVRSDEGVRQGDAFSAFFFCVLMDQVCFAVKERFPDAHVWSYMDDLTIAVEPSLADDVIRSTIAIMKDIGFQPNMTKSKCFSIDRSFVSDFLQTSHDDESFELLGGNISSNFEAMNREQTRRNAMFLDVLRSCDIHPQLQWTILRLCGFPTLRYYASITPPEVAMPVLMQFRDGVHDFVQQLVGAPVDSALLHDVHGGGFPDYVTHAEELYENARTAR